MFEAAVNVFVISNRISFQVLFDKIAFVYFIWEIYLYFSIGNGEPRQPALCQMYRHTFFPYCVHVTKHFDVGLYRTLNQKPTSSLLSCRPELKPYLPCCGKKARNRSTEFHIIIQPFDLIHTGCEHSSIRWRPTCRLRVFFLYICYADTRALMAPLSVIALFGRSNIISNCVGWCWIRSK